MMDAGYLQGVIFTLLIASFILSMQKVEKGNTAAKFWNQISIDNQELSY